MPAKVILAVSNLSGIIRDEYIGRSPWSTRTPYCSFKSPRITDSPELWWVKHSVLAITPASTCSEWQRLRGVVHSILPSAHPCRTLCAAIDTARSDLFRRRLDVSTGEHGPVCCLRRTLLESSAFRNLEDANRNTAIVVFFPMRDARQRSNIQSVNRQPENSCDAPSLSLVAAVI